jgi:pSer/pThr/pTyr-binding forkhead associated (FHA) protein
MEVKLLVTNEKSRTREVRLGPETVIGRARECHLRIVSGQVSRRHCVILVEDNRVVVRDLGSANGTEVDGAVIPPEIDVPVASGSLLVIGPLKFMFEFLSPDHSEPNEDDLQSTTQDISPLPGMTADKNIDDTKDYGLSARQARIAPGRSAGTRFLRARSVGGGARFPRGRRWRRARRSRRRIVARDLRRYGLRQ